MRSNNPIRRRCAGAVGNHPSNSNFTLAKWPVFGDTHERIVLWVMRLKIVNHTVADGLLNRANNRPAIHSPQRERAAAVFPLTANFPAHKTYASSVCVHDGQHPRHYCLAVAGVLAVADRQRVNVIRGRRNTLGDVPEVNRSAFVRAGRSVGNGCGRRLIRCKYQCRLPERRRTPYRCEQRYDQ